MKVLIACEFSGLVRDEFIASGFDAMSCDLQETERPGPHYKGNVLDVLYNGWDVLIGFPPCTYLSNAGNAYWDRPGRAQKRLDALQFFNTLLTAPIKHIALENPVGIIDRVIRKHDQIIHPYFFGEAEMKRTCLWLQNLPKLVHSENHTLFYNATHTHRPQPVYIDKSGKNRYATEAKRYGNNDRSRTYAAIAKAMAMQWGFYLKQQNTVCHT